jgi:hypothetical protein
MKINEKTFLLLIVLLTVINITLGDNNFIDLQKCHPRLLKQRKMQFCYVSWVDINGKTFLVKQKRSASYLLAVVHDVFASLIAHELDPSLAQKVILIPAFHKFPGKIYDDWPATIHTLASGKTIKKKIRNPYRKMNIKQASQGFRREMLPWMAQHIQLAKIVALDIFLCNHDRHRGNLFYDNKTDTFCAIDMDALYKYNLAEYAYQNLLRMTEDGPFSLTTKEVIALLEMRKTLEWLVNHYSPEDMLALFDHLCCHAGLVEGSTIYVPRVRAEIEITRNMITHYYRDVKKLIEVLGDIIQKAIRQAPTLRDYQKIVEFEWVMKNPC